MSSGLLEDSPPARRSAARRALPGAALLAALYVAAAGVYAALALRSPLPVLFPDEFRYAHLARALADGQGFTWRGADVGQSAALYVYFITPAWALLHSTTDAYAATKVLGTLALCAQVVPVWLLARELVGPRLALAPALLSVAGTWMLSAAETTTEALAFPLSATALCLAVLALRRPGGRLGLAALAFALLAAWARLQVAVLVPALLAAFALDVVRRPDPAARRARLRAHRATLVAAGALTAAGVLAAVAAPSLSGDYAGVFDMRPSAARIAGKSALQLAELTALAGFLPVLLAAAAAASPRAWRDERAGPLLAVFWCAAAATVVQSGFYLAGYPSATWGVQRYAAYAAPLAFVLLTVLVADPRLLGPRALAGAAVLATALLLRPEIRLMGAERAAWSTGHRLHQALGLGLGPALALTALALVAVVAVVRRRTANPARAVLAVTAAVCAVFAIQDQAGWQQLTQTTRTFRTVFPADLQWIDHHAGGPVALLGVTQNAPQFDSLDFFNRSIAHAYVPRPGLPGRAVQGATCWFEIAPTGALRVQPSCGPPPRRFLVNDPSARITFHDEVAAATDAHVGRLAAVAPGRAARVRSLLVLACPRMTPTFYDTTPAIRPADASIACRPSTSGSLWLDAPGQVVARYRGGAAAQTVTVAGQRWSLPARTVTDVRFAVPRGFSQFALTQDWSSSAGTPQLLTSTLVQGDTRVPLL